MHANKCVSCFFIILILVSAVSAENFTFTADSVRSVMTSGKEKTVLTGNVKVISGKLVISADSIEISGKNFVDLLCTGNVVADDAEQGIHLETPELKYNRDKKISQLTGPSTLVDQENKVVLKARYIENDGEHDIAQAQINVRILKDKIATRSEYVLYRRKEKTLELTGAPQAFKDSDSYSAARIIVNTETDEIKLDGAVQGQIITQSQSKPGVKDNTVPEPTPDDNKAPGAQVPAGKSSDTLQIKPDVDTTSKRAN